MKKNFNIEDWAKENKWLAKEAFEEFEENVHRHKLAIEFGVVNLLPSNWTPQQFRNAVEEKYRILYEKSLFGE